MDDSFSIVIIIVCMIVAFFSGISTENIFINNDCKNLGHSYTDKYYLNCEVKK